jgi:tetratricopeptide (TPR) repeat protein
MADGQASYIQTVRRCKKLTNFSVLFDIGNLELAKNALSAAKQHYEDALDICEPLGRTSLLVAAIYYRLGLTELALLNYSTAKYFLRYDNKTFANVR